MLKQIEPKKVRLCDVDFAIFPFGAMKAANLSGELGRFFGPLVAGFLPLIGSDDDVLSMDLTQAMPMITGAFSVLDGDTVEKLLRKLLLGGNVACSYINDKGDEVQSKLTQDLLDNIFCQNVDDLYRLAVEVINLNYSGFFKKLLNQSGGLVEKAKTIVLGSTETLTQSSSQNLN